MKKLFLIALSRVWILAADVDLRNAEILSFTYVV